MADRKITELSAMSAGTQATGDLLTIVDVSEAAAVDKNKKITVESLFKGIPGSVGIGTAAPGANLEVKAASIPTIRLNQADTYYAPIKLVGNDLEVRGSSGSLEFYTGANNGDSSTERMRLDSSGRVGIAITPYAWETASTSQVLQVRAGVLTDYNSAQFDVGRNYYYDGSAYKYGSSSTAERLTFFQGSHIFSSAASGSANAALTWLERMRIDSSGKLLVNTTSALVSAGRIMSYFNGAIENGLQIHDTRTTSGSDTAIIFTRNTSVVGSITTGTTATAYNTSSDYRLKENVVDIADGITRVKQLQPKRFNFIIEDTTTVDGFLAHEAQTVVPEAVTGTHNEVDGDGNAVMQGIDQSKLVPLLTAALQEAIAKIETLEAKVAALEAG